MKKLVVTVLAILMILPICIFAQATGKVVGVVTDAKTNAPLAGANVLIEGTVLGAAADADGSFIILNVPVGTYDVSASIISHKKLTIQEVRVLSSVTTELNFELEESVIRGQEVTVVAERKLFEKSVTSSVSMTTSDELENIPVRGVGNIISNMAGVVTQDGSIHIRGGRPHEVKYFVGGVSTSLPTTNVNVMTIIHDAIEEIQVFAGGYTADMGNANAGIVKTEIKSGGTEMKGSLELRTDGFRDPALGKKVLGTYNYGHNSVIATIGGPLGEKIKFFVAGQYDNQKDSEVRFSEGFEFADKVNNNPNDQSNKDTVDLIYPDGFTPHASNMTYAINGSITLDLPVRLRLDFMHDYSKYDRTYNAPPMLNTLNNRTYYYTSPTTMISAKATKLFTPTSYLDLKGSYFRYGRELNDPYFGNDWTKWYDSSAVHEATNGEVVYRNSWRPQYNYVINGFPITRDGTPLAVYVDQEQSYWGVNLDYVNQFNKHNELKFGLDYKNYTVRQYSVNPSAYVYAADSASAARAGYTGYGSLEAVPIQTWVFNGGIDAYGFDAYGNKTNIRTVYADGTYIDAPKHPVEFSAYLMDKIEYNDLIINAGLRFDYFDTDDRELVDPANPAVDPNTSMLADSAWAKKKPTMHLSPRLGFSFPVDDKTVFYLNYGQFVQMPQLSEAYFSSYTYARQIVRQGYYFLNPVGFGLDPLYTTSYEVGFRREISDFAAFDATAFYKNVKGLIEVIKQLPSSGSTIPGYYDKYENGDFATQKGFELRMNMRRTYRLAGSVNYTLTLAEGTASNSTAAHGALYMNTIMPSTINPLDFSQMHTGAINLDYRFGDNDGGPILENMGANLLVSFSSGHPFTMVDVLLGGQTDPYTAGIDYMEDTRNRIAREPIGSSKTPWQFNTDLRVDKSFVIGGFKANVFVMVTNLFNRKNVINVYEFTGNAYDDGFLTDPVRSQSTVDTYGGQDYIDMYTAINLVNGQAYWDNVGRELYSNPRQINVGLRLSF
ncbi:MAG: TonB-dependent receptor [Candidatus Neomarinimicrobiota bacterium]|jgi:outer membrane receptor protein involved in Fe transport|nr:TonB-dependent receptor [bacterium]